MQWARRWGLFMCWRSTVRGNLFGVLAAVWILFYGVLMAAVVLVLVGRGGGVIPMFHDTTHSTVVIWVNFFQTELMFEIYSKGLVRAIGKVLLMKFS